MAIEGECGSLNVKTFAPDSRRPGMQAGLWRGLDELVILKPAKLWRKKDMRHKDLDEVSGSHGCVRMRGSRLASYSAGYLRTISEVR
jgi:hypothetical protein